MENNIYKHIIYDTGFVTRFDIDGNLTFINQNYCQVSGFEENEIVGKPYRFLGNDVNLPINKIEKELLTKLKNGEVVKYIFKNYTKDGKPFFMDTSIYPIKKDGKIEEFITFATNLTEYIELITYDKLTGLKNKDIFHKDIDNTKSYICIVTKLDNLSDIFEFYGGELADKLILKVAKRLKVVFKGCELYRFQTDEFVILKQLPVNYDKDKLSDMMKFKLKSAFDNQFLVDDLDINLTITSGLSIGNKNYLRNANLAFKSAKLKNTSYCVYQDQFLMQFANFTTNKKVACDIKQAIRDDQIIPYYQPIVDNTTQKVIKYEALARLIKQDDVVPPGAFIDVSKKIRYYHKITRAMLKKCFEHFGSNQNIGVSINITIEDIANIRTFNLIIELLSKNQFNHNITFELVESDGIEDDKLFNRFVDTIRSYGAKISIDDFGTGYSNFTYLAKIEPDYLKIDGSLIKNIVHTKDFDVVKTIINFAKLYGIKTVAEFVEDEDIYILVKELGIDYSQGYYFGKPIHIDEYRKGLV